MYLSFNKVNYSVFVNSLRGLKIVPILLALVCLVFSYFIRAIRWKYILVDSNLKFSHLFSASMIGNMGNNIFPMRMGEVIRCYALGYQENMSKSRILASVLFERVIDGVTVLLFFLGCLFFTDVGGIFIDGAIILFTVFGSIFILLFIGKQHQESSFKFLSYLFYFLPQNIKDRSKNILNSFFSGLGIFHNRKYFMISILYSLLFWGLGILGNYFLLISTGKVIPLYLPVILISALVIGVMIPSAPGFIGTYHYVVILVLVLYGWEKETAASVSIVLHGIQFIVPTIIGLVLTFKLGFSFKSLIGNNVKESIE